MAEAETVRQHHRLSGRESEQTLGNREAQGSLECLSMGSQRVGRHLVTEEQQQATSLRSVLAFPVGCQSLTVCIFRMYGSSSISPSAASDPLRPVACGPPGSSVRETLRQENWSGLLFPSSEDLSGPGMEPGSQVLYRLNHREDPA